MMVVGNFPDGNSALMFVAAWLRHVIITTWKFFSPNVGKILDNSRASSQENDYKFFKGITNVMLSFS